MTEETLKIGMQLNDKLHLSRHHLNQCKRAVNISDNDAAYICTTGSDIQVLIPKKVYSKILQIVKDKHQQEINMMLQQLKEL